MKRIGSFEAKTHFAALLREVESTGERVIVQRHGKDVVTIAPCEEADAGLPAQERKRIIAELKELHEAQAGRTPLRDMTVREMIEDGRKR
ncbi:MAG: type II toxin-antitoxin system Phd/YefM family antitoxin [Planctomycetota bacterium]